MFLNTRNLIRETLLWELKIKFISLKTSITLLHELHTPGGGSEPGVTGPVFWYVIAEVFLHNIKLGVEIL